MSGADAASYRIGVDVGGTFTDLVLIDEARGGLSVHKEPSTPDDPSLAVELGIGRLLAAAKVAPFQVAGVIHGTTIALNAIIQRKGAPVALVVSCGNRDVLELGRCRMPSPYDFSVGREDPLVPRDRVFEVTTRIGPDGSVVAAAEEAEIEDLAGRIRASGAEAVAVCLLNSYRAPEVERQLADALRARLARLQVGASADVWPEIREYERASMAVMNAYVHPLMRCYFDRLSERLQGLGLRAGLQITTSNGGVVGVASARERPIETLLSGPASGVTAAGHLARRCGRGALMTLDMGGTSADMGLSEDGEATTSTASQVGDFPLMMPVVEVRAIGAGGGSIVWVDEQGLLKVGPESAGAAPGPVCYGRGGERPTLTDCYLVAGFLSADSRLAGQIALDAGAARAALAEVAARAGLRGPDAAVAAAEAALRIATAKMGAELRKGAAVRGVDPRRFTLVPFGGAGPTHAGLLAEEVGMDSILIPDVPGAFCALGAAIGDVKRDFVRSVTARLGQGGEAMGRLRLAVAEMREEAAEWIAGEAGGDSAVALNLAADARYAGQAYNLPVELGPCEPEELTEERLVEAFHAAHEAIYGFRDSESVIEVVTVRMQALGRRETARPAVAGMDDRAPVSGARRRIYARGGWHEAPVYRRDTLAPGIRLAGPCVVEQADTTAVVPPGWDLSVDGIGNLALARNFQ